MCSVRVPLALVISSVLATCSSGGAATTLSPGIPIEAEIASGEVQAYQISLAAGQYARIRAQQETADVQLAVSDPLGHRIIESDTLGDIAGPEFASVVAEVTGPYRIEIRVATNAGNGGRYRIRIDELRKAVPGDEARMAAEKLFAEGSELENARNAEAYARAAAKFEQALSISLTLHDTWHEALALKEIGLLDVVTSKLQSAIQRLNEALPLWRATGDASKEADTLNDLANAYRMSGDIPRALELESKALSLCRAAGDRLQEPRLTSNLGAIYTYLGQYEEALPYLIRTREAAHAAGFRHGETVALVNLSGAYDMLGEYRKALDQLAQARSVVRSDDRDGLARILRSLGRLYSNLGDIDQAMSYDAQALAVFHGMGDAFDEMRVLQHMGDLCGRKHDYEKALGHLKQALSISQASHARVAEPNILVGIGSVYADLGDKPKALSYYSKAIQSSWSSEDGKAGTLVEASLLYTDSEKALQSVNTALSISQSLHVKPLEARALAARARLEHNQGKLNEARGDLYSWLQIIETARGELNPGELRTAYLESNVRTYELYIEVLMDLHQREAAFEISERARARSLLETLGEMQANIREGVDRELLDHERSLERQVNALEAERLRLLTAKHGGAEQMDAVEKELNKVLEDYEDVRARIRVTSPRYAALTQPQPLSLKEIQERVLDEDTLLLEYALGESHSYLWAVTTTSIDSYVLPKRAEIEMAAKRAYDLLRASNQREFQGQSGLALSNLSRMLLAVATQDLRKKRLLIVSDGALQYIPFAALPAPEALKTRGKPLVVDHEIVNAPSASVIGILRREAASRVKGAKAVAILADPVFEETDPRVRTASAKDSGMPPSVNEPAKDDLGSAELVRSLNESGLARLGRLPFSRGEADSIKRLVPAGEALEALDFQASKQTAMSADIAQFRIVHFATHSLINSQHPELSGIILSLVDSRGRPQDGFLRVREIYNLKLAADTVVLSACETALGKEVRGEGLLSITRGFMYAGSPRVVASLWEVRDEATAELMSRFYVGIFDDHLRPGAALQAAQIAMSRDKRWGAPFYWSAFVIQGEWR